ncbi:Hypothetical protein PBC10988_19670 [Planctomycetales bacterium 10988]|nr:Hypothetical protein PBC10988_19670 [Planctomycetales bacterium 10988]
MLMAKVGSRNGAMMQTKLTGLLVCGVFCVAPLVASAQPVLFDRPYYEHANYAPKPDFDTGSLFAPLDLSSYGSGPPPNEGFFFNYDYLNWSISAPPSTFVGQDPANVSTVYNQDGSQVVLAGGRFLRSSLDTGNYYSEFESGSRVEFGYVVDDKGLLFSGFGISQNEEETIGANRSDVNVFGDNENINGPLVLFDDPYDLVGLQGTDSRFGIAFSTLTARNEIETFGGELMRIWRLKRPPRPYYPTMDFMFGVRYLQFEENFDVKGTQYPDADISSNDTVYDSFFHSEGVNNLVGPQFGGRFFKQWGPFAMAFEGRFFAAFNFQQFKQRNEFDPRYLEFLTEDSRFIPNSQTNSIDFTEFSPTGEIRVEMSYLLTRKIRVRGGWSGTYMAGIARTSNLVEYSVGEMGFNGDNTQEVFMHGVHMGIEVNH